MTRPPTPDETAALDALAERLEDRLVSARIRGSRRVVHADPDAPENLALLLRLASADLDRRLALALDDEAVTLAESDVLRRVARRPGGPAEIGEYLGRSPQRVGAIVAGLEAAGLVEREGSWRDGRVRQVRPTEAGFDVLLGLDAPTRRILGLLLAILAVG